ncbi:GAGT3-like protein [Mya arenaria]|uniref:GAGT3-like protein n=2 Tax=Mya arenaria TaxID=6604 RepID=A0ABY7DJU0_MYAAR|nr:GAGT3-like protein [Mya arenaria]
MLWNKNVCKPFSPLGGLAIGIPGEIKGLYKAWKLGGRLPWKQLLQPAIKLCKEGFKVGNALEAAIRSTSRFFPDFPNLRDLLTNPATNGIYKKGETMKAPKLAQTLETIAKEGPDAFYNGSLSANIAADIQDAG